MSMDLVISEQGRVMIASSDAFPAEVSRVDFDAASRYITLNYAGDTHAPTTLPVTVGDRLAPALAQAPRVLLVAVRNKRILHGYDVPLTCIES